MAKYLLDTTAIIDHLKGKKGVTSILGKAEIFLGRRPKVATPKRLYQGLNQEHLWQKYIERIKRLNATNRLLLEELEDV